MLCYRLNRNPVDALRAILLVARESKCGGESSQPAVLDKGHLVTVVPAFLQGVWTFILQRCDALNAASCWFA